MSTQRLNRVTALSPTVRPSEAREGSASHRAGPPLPKQPHRATRGWGATAPSPAPSLPSRWRICPEAAGSRARSRAKSAASARPAAISPHGPGAEAGAGPLRRRRRFLLHLAPGGAGQAGEGPPLPPGRWRGWNGMGWDGLDWGRPRALPPPRRGGMRAARRGRARCGSQFVRGIALLLPCYLESYYRIVLVGKDAQDHRVQPLTCH